MQIQLISKDNHELDAYVSSPKIKEKGSIIVIQEIFGITDHIKSVCKTFSSHGYKTIAPALYDRFEKNIILDYNQIEEGKSFKERLAINHAMNDINAAISICNGPVAIVGYCYGGMLSHVAASKLKLNCAVSYYGGLIAENHLDKSPNCPIMYHFGERDIAIPMESVDLIMNEYPNAIIHTYPEAGHGFNCEMRSDYDEPSAVIALKRTLNFLDLYCQ
jgi:carboxymethylenebutenolidase